MSQLSQLARRVASLGPRVRAAARSHPGRAAGVAAAGGVAGGWAWYHRTPEPAARPAWSDERRFTAPSVDASALLGAPDLRVSGAIHDPEEIYTRTIEVGQGDDQYAIAIDWIPLGARSSDLVEIEQWIGETAERYAGEMQLPDGLTVWAYAKNMGPVFVPTRTIRVGRHLAPNDAPDGTGLENLPAAAGTEARTTAVHELGHAFFDHNGPALAGDDRFAEAAESPLGHAYHELVADVLAADAVGDPEAGLKAMTYLNGLTRAMPDYRNEPLSPPIARSFDNDLDPATWLKDAESLTPHVIFGPARGVIGAEFPELISSPAGVKEAMGVLAKDLVRVHADPDRYLKDPSVETKFALENLDIEALNVHVIDVFRAHYKAKLS